MIVKVFKAATSFTGVNYNERKNENGKSELLAANNFAINSRNPTKADYIAYMEAVCNTNKNVKNKQFHATISCKGREYSVEELKDIAEKYIEKMGYKNNPYLIYFHSDTDNNHVHIVSTRVNKQGEKINDSMEAIRSHKVLNEIMGIDLPLKAEKDISKFLDYSFSSIAQYKLLLECSGWKTGEKENNIELYKSGRKQGEVLKDQVLEKISIYKPNKERQKQVAALLRKYKKGLSTKELQTLMKDKFGIELIFHMGKSHLKPYGYSIIDNSRRAVYKGSEVLELKSLLEDPRREQRIDELPNVINSILAGRNDITLQEFKVQLEKYGYRFLSMSGNVYLKGERKAILEIDKDVFERLKYNTRLTIANEYKVNTKDEANLIARLYSVSPDSIMLSDERKRDPLLYSDVITSFMLNSSDVRTSLAEKGYSFFEFNNNIYLIDERERVIVNVSELDIRFEELVNSTQPISINRCTDIDRVGDSLYKDPDYSRGENAIEILCDILSYHSSSVQDDSQRRRKRKGIKQN